jgi:hypothetical protein
VAASMAMRCSMAHGIPTASSMTRRGGCSLRISPSGRRAVAAGLTSLSSNVIGGTRRGGRRQDAKALARHDHRAARIVRNAFEWAATVDVIEGGNVPGITTALRALSRLKKGRAARPSASRWLDGLSTRRCLACRHR